MYVLIFVLIIFFICVIAVCRELFALCRLVAKLDVKLTISLWKVIVKYFSTSISVHFYLIISHDIF